jgi:hypothetical protein
MKRARESCDARGGCATTTPSLMFEGRVVLSRKQRLMALRDDDVGVSPEPREEPPPRVRDDVATGGVCVPDGVTSFPSKGDCQIVLAALCQIHMMAQKSLPRRDVLTRVPHLLIFLRTWFDRWVKDLSRDMGGMRNPANRVSRSVVVADDDFCRDLVWLRGDGTRTDIPLSDSVIVSNLVVGCLRTDVASAEVWDSVGPQSRLLPVPVIEAVSGGCRGSEGSAALELDCAVAGSVLVAQLDHPVSWCPCCQALYLTSAVVAPRGSNVLSRAFRSPVLSATNVLVTDTLTATPDAVYRTSVLHPSSVRSLTGMEVDTVRLPWLPVRDMITSTRGVLDVADACVASHALGEPVVLTAGETGTMCIRRALPLVTAACRGFVEKKPEASVSLVKHMLAMGAARAFVWCSARVCVSADTAAGAPADSRPVQAAITGLARYLVNSGVALPEDVSASLGPESIADVSCARRVILCPASGDGRSETVK